MKINETENRIMNYCDNIFDIYPKYNKYLNLNNNISDYILAIYYTITFLIFIITFIIERIFS